MPTPPVFKSTTVSALLPLITIRVTDTYVAQLVIPGSARAAYILAHRICARVLERDEQVNPSDPEIKPGRKLGGHPTCLVLELSEGDEEAASQSAEALVNAATEVARDAAGFATHRIERK